MTKAERTTSVGDMFVTKDARGDAFSPVSRLYDVESIKPESVAVTKLLTAGEPHFNQAVLGQKDRAIQRKGESFFRIRDERNKLTSTAASSGGLSVAESSIVLAHLAGGIITYNHAFSDLAQMTPLSSEAKDFVDLEKFLTCSEVTSTLHGVSLRSITEQKKQKKLPIDSLLQFFMDVRAIDERQVPDGVLEENTSALAVTYPQLHLQGLERIGILSRSLLNTSEFMGMEAYRLMQRRFPLTAPTTEALVRNISDFHNRLKTTVADPESTEFPQLKERIESVMDSGIGSKLFLIHLFTLARVDTLQSVFRKTASQATHPDHGEFYQKFTDMFHQYADAVSEFTQLRTKDDTEEVFTPMEGDNPKPVPTFDDYRKTIVDIIKYKPSSKDQYDVPVDDITWGEITEPQSVKVTFDEDRPMLFRVELHYEREEEETNIVVEADAKKKRFDWNYLEDPEALEMKPFSNAVKKVVLQSLTSVEQQVRSERQAKDASKTVFRADDGRSLRIRDPKVRPESEVEPPRKKRQRVDQNPMEVFAETVKLNAEGKNTILLPDGDVDTAVNGLRKEMKRLSDSDRRLVIEGIRRYNETGAGGFKMLQGRSAEGKKLYSLRINIGGKGVRVLVKEGESEEGDRKFTILAIGRRGNTFRKGNQPEDYS